MPFSANLSLATAVDERLAVLDELEILDTGAEQGFDDIVQLATQICEAPVALVSLVAKDRQWFKARVGFPLCETPLSQSVCALTLDREDLLIIPDLTVDPRTRDNTLVTGEPHIRFYAGAPLRTPEGVGLGSLCVIDTVPRPDGLTEPQQTALAALARQVLAQLQLRRAIVNREQAMAARALVEEELRLAVDATAIGIFDFNPATNELRWDARTRELFGVPARGSVTYETSFLAGLHPDDRAMADAAVSAAIDPNGERAFDIEYRVRPLDGGAERWLAARGRALVQNGATYRFIGTVRDITARKTTEASLRTTEERYRLAALATTDAIWDWDLVTDHVLWNEAIHTAYGHELAEIQTNGAWWIGQIHPDDRSRIADSIHHVIDDGGLRWSGSYRFRRADDTYADVVDNGHVLRNSAGAAVRMIGAMLDVTEREASARALTASEARKSALIEIGDRLRDLGSPEAMSVAAAEIAATTLRLSRAGFGQVEPDGEHVTIDADWCQPGQVSLIGRHRFSAYGDLKEEIGRGHPVIIQDVRTDWRTAQSPERMLAIGVHSLVNLPLQEHGRTVALFIAHDTQPREWTPAEIVFLSSVVDRVAVGVARLQAEEQREILARELAHRLKNTLAMVQAIVTQTLRNSPDLQHAKQALTARLMTMSKAHDLLLTGQAEGTDIQAVIEAALRAHDDDSVGRFEIKGPFVRCSEGPALSLALMIHELATNAAKYGALSVPAGRVAITWGSEPGSPDLQLVWREQGGPLVTAPTRKGFGSRLIERGLAGAVDGQVQLAYPVDGVTCTISAPLTGFEV